MSFKKWLNDFEEAYIESVLSYAEKEGLKLKGNKLLVPKDLEDKSIQLFIAYKNQRATKMLVWATWILALSTITLSIITFF
jgi:hypothetical protein